MNKRTIRQTLGRLGAIAALCAGLTAGATAAAATAEPQPSPSVTQAELPTTGIPPTGDVDPLTVNLAISAPERLIVNRCYQTPKACLIFQGDGNLVVYDEKGAARWNSGTWGYTNAYADFQTDGNLVVYTHTGVPLWNSGTYKSPGATLWVQADGNVVIYNKTGTPVWATYTDH